MDGSPIIQLPLWGQATNAAAYLLGGIPFRSDIAAASTDVRTALSLLASFISRRTAHEDAPNVRERSHMSWARILLISFFVVSWLSIITSKLYRMSLACSLSFWVCLGATVIVTAESKSSGIPCVVAQYACIILYATTKVFVYFFLSTSVLRLEPYIRPDVLLPVEKVHIVWGPLKGERRFRSPIYLTCLATTLFYLIYVVIVLVLHGKSFCNHPLLHNTHQPA